MKVNGKYEPSMERLTYYEDSEVPVFITNALSEELSPDLQELLYRAVMEVSEQYGESFPKMISAEFGQKKVIEEKNEFIGLFNIFDESEQSTSYVVELRLYGDDNTVIYYTDRSFNEEQRISQVYIIKKWNGKTENLKIDDHYIVMIKPEEYKEDKYGIQ